MRTTLDPIPTLPVGGSYVVGIDAGQNSVGLFALSLTAEGVPHEILAMQSVIHDGGLDPDKTKSSVTRKASAGFARRARRRLRVEKKRLNRLEKLLDAQGWQGRSEAEFPTQIWEDRSRAATAFIEDDAERAQVLGDVFRHIARHRGWRNPYQPLADLFQDESQSDAFTRLVTNAQRLGAQVDDSCTIGQIVWAALNCSHPADLDAEDEARWANSNQLRIRTLGTESKKRPGLIDGRLFQVDNVHEIQQICATQNIPAELEEELLKTIFYQKKASAGVMQTVGRCGLQPQLLRCSKAHPEFQRYRIAATLATLKIKDDHTTRFLTAEERQKVAAELHNPHTKIATWGDVADLLGIEAPQLTGIASTTPDAELIVAARPPVDTTTIKMATKAKPFLKKWWNDATPEQQQDFIELQVNFDTDNPDVNNYLLTLTPTELAEIETFSTKELPKGRASFAAETCRILADHLLNSDDSLADAIEKNFHRTPAVAKLTESTGIASVDRSLKIVSRFLQMARNYWGEPKAITVELAREGLMSAKAKSDMEFQQRRARKARQTLQEKRGIREDNRRDTLRAEALQRQNNRCMYCGAPIDMHSVEMDHIVPRSGPGATNRVTNLAGSCHRCNQAKGGRTYAEWVKQDNPTYTNPKMVEEFVRHSMNFSYQSMPEKQMQEEYLRALRTTRKEEAPDSRSLAPTATMGTILRGRLQAEFPTTSINVLAGFITAEARHAAGYWNLPTLHVEGDPHRNNKRIDRRHHAIDAAIMSITRHYAAEVLAQRRALREQERTLGSSYRPATVNNFYGSWKDFTGTDVAHKTAYGKWLSNSHVLIDLITEKLLNDEIPVWTPLRLSLSDGRAHDDTVRPLAVRPVKSALTAKEIDASATPAQWCALTRCEDYDEKTGLPENPDRHIVLNGTHLGPDDTLEFFTHTSPSKGKDTINEQAAVKVRGGWAAAGDFHHLRLYRIPKKNGFVYFFMRVLPIDLPSTGDLFHYELPPQSISVRQAHPKLKAALKNGDAVYLTWLVKDDVIEVDPSVLTNNAKLQESLIPNSVLRWKLIGFENVAYQLKLEAVLTSKEGVMDRRSNTGVDSRFTAECQRDLDATVLSPKGWRVSAQLLLKAPLRIIRYDALGRERLSPRSPLPHTLTIEP